MADIKISDLVDPKTFEDFERLDKDMKDIVTTYTDTAKELAKGLTIPVKMIGDIDKLNTVYSEKTKEAAQATEKLIATMERQRQIVANTTNTISRELMEQERSNKLQRDAYVEHEKVNDLLQRVNGSYQARVTRLVEVNTQIEQNKKKQKEANELLKSGTIDQQKYQTVMEALVTSERTLKQQKSDLTSQMRAEEKLAGSVEGSYRSMSQQLELLKKAYKEMDEAEKNTAMGKELETTIQNLDAHLKDMAADMGEFQRNVGNYAIAGQNGVVTTESVVAALSQEALTTQDLIDQTKILEEAKTRLNQNDANYQTTLDAINAKLEDNRQKLTDVSDILGKEATSVAEAEAQNKRLMEAIKNVDLTSVNAKKKLEDMRNQIERNNRTIANATGANEKFADSVLGILGINANLGSSFQSLGQNGNFIDGLNTKVKAFGKTLMGLLANPVVLAFLGIAGVVAGFKWWYDYNKGLEEASRLTKNFTDMTGTAADKVTADMQAMADHMGKGYDDTIGAANTLVQQFGITWQEAMGLMQKGIVAGADMSGAMLNNINQFGPALRDAGVSADEFMSILAETRNGIFNERGIQDIMKGGTRLKAMTKQMAESLDAVGISSQQMQKDLTEGNITMLEAVQQVAQRLKEIPENSQEAGLVMKNVFGRTAAEGGTLLIQSIADVNTNLDVAIDRMGELGKVNEEQMNAQKELNEVLSSIFKMSGTSFEEMTTRAKTFVIQGLTNIIKGCVDIVNWFIRMYNKSMLVRGAVNAIGNSFKLMWEVAKFILNQIMTSFKGMASVIEGVVTLDWDKIKQGWQEGMESLKGNVESFARNVAGNFATAFNNTISDELKEVTIGLDANLDVSNAGSATLPDPDFPPGGGKPDGNGGKELEKQMKEELKILQELEEAKIQLMKEGHDKEMATIRLNYKKKIDAVTGNSENEQALRVQLMQAMMAELENCELEYQRNLAKIDLENRLASVKKGSKEELDLKLAQLESERQVEIREAEKTGADVLLIEAKFNLRRREMQEEYASTAASKIEESYSGQAVMRDAAYARDVNALRKKYAEEMAQTGTNYAKQEELKDRLYTQLEQLDESYAIETAQSSIDMLQDILQTEDLSAEDRLKYERDLAKAKADLETAMADHAIAEMERVNDEDKKSRDARIANAITWLEKTGEALNAINELISTVYDAKIEKIEEEEERNTEAGEAEQERIAQLVEQNVITEEEGEARKRAAEAKTAQKEAELERQKAKLKEKQAKFDKANSIVQAIIATATSILETSKMGFPAAIPFIAMAGAMGALQLATIMATPLPKYAKGTKNHEGGPAIVGDGGRNEVVMYRGDAWLTPDQPTLVDIPKGAVVFPSMEDFSRQNPSGIVMSVISDNRSPVETYDDRKVRSGVSEVVRAINRQTAQQKSIAYREEYERYKNSRM